MGGVKGDEGGKNGGSGVHSEEERLEQFHNQVGIVRITMLTNVFNVLLFEYKLEICVYSKVAFAFT